ncbi:MAG: hypothetical protein P8X55_21405, partial [Desulfosarcinaceae bacterium]
PGLRRRLDPRPRQVFVLDEAAAAGQLDDYAEFYRRCLERRLETEIPRHEFERGLALNAMDLALVRFNLYLMGHNLLHFPFMERVYGNLAGFISRTWDARV